MSRVLLTAWLLLMCANNSVICYLTSNRRNYQKILLDDHVVERIHLLSPSNLLANRKCDGSDTLNNSCSRDLDFLKRDLPQRKEWALKMMDSSSKPQSGFLNGFFINIGSYDQCISINENLSNNVIRGRHCMYAVNPTTHKKPFPYNPVISICLPASCNSENVAELVNTTANQNELLKIIELEWVFCSPLDSEKSDDGIGFIILFLIALYVCFLGVCTVCHMHRKILFSPETINSKLFQSLCNLSFAKNNRIIFDTKVDESHLSIINGIRVISTAWIVLSHEYIFDLFQVNINLLDLLKFYSSWKSLIPLIGIFSVDTFLAMSGFLMTYTFFKKMNKKVNFSIYQYYIHRYIRLTAPVAVVLAIMMYVYPSVGSGPRWDWFLRIFVTGIREKWWSILLYLQNYIDKDNLCVLHLWSLAVDMQLYWISPLILFPLHRKPKLGITIVLALCVASIVASGAIVAVNQYPAIYATHEPDMELIMSEFRDVYITTHTRASPWCIGIIFGYAVVTKRKRPSKATMWCGWLATISALIFCLYSSRYFTDTNYVYDIVREVIFASLARPAWAFAICWLVYASAHDCAGPITNILSWKYFQPLSRLSYCIYLVHVVFPLARASTTRTPTFFHDYITWQSCICDLFLSIVMAWGVSITFEVPILALENMINNLRAARSRERKDK